MHIQPTLFDDVQQVEYHDAPGYPGYRVGDDGSVWSCLRRKGLGTGRGSCFVIGKNWQKMKASPNKRGYLLVCLAVNGRKKYFQVHRLVLLAFVGPCPEGMQACHDPDRNKTNCALCNLRWGTPESNYADRDRHGTTARGERIGSAKLTEDEVVEIRNLHFSCGVSMRKLARKFKVAHSTIQGVISNKTWKIIAKPEGRP